MHTHTHNTHTQATELSDEDQANMVGLFKSFAAMNGKDVGYWTLRFSGARREVCVFVFVCACLLCACACACVCVLWNTMCSISATYPLPAQLGSKHGLAKCCAML